MLIVEGHLGTCGVRHDGRREGHERMIHEIAADEIVLVAEPGLLHPVGLALNPKDGEIYVSDSVRNGVLSFLVPQLFQSNALNTDQRAEK